MESFDNNIVKHGKIGHSVLANHGSRRGRTGLQQRHLTRDFHRFGGLRIRRPPVRVGPGAPFFSNYSHSVVLSEPKTSPHFARDFARGLRLAVAGKTLSIKNTRPLVTDPKR
jgi:hypothetical protein